MIDENAAKPETTDVPEKLIARVQALIAKAESSDFPEERDAFFAKAEALMTANAISKGMLDSAKPRDKREKPKMVVMPFPGDHEFKYDLLYMMRRLARNGRSRMAWSTWVTITIVGYEDDLEYVQMLWLSIYLAFSSKLDPKWDDLKTVDQNIKDLKEAGFKWAYIAEQANRHGGCEFKGGTDGGLKRAVKRECKRLGVEYMPHTQRNGAYRTSFSEYFSSQVSYRLDKQYLRQQEQAGESTGAEVVLRDRGSWVDEEFYKLFPQERPMSAEERDARAKAMREHEEREAARWARLTDEERAAEFKQQAKKKAKLDAEDTRRREAEFDKNGARAGERAGRQVDLSGGRNGVSDGSSRMIEG